MGFPSDSVIKNSPAVQEMWVRFLGQEDPLEKERATHSSILAWEIPWIGEPVGLQPMGLQKSRTWLRGLIGKERKEDILGRENNKYRGMQVHVEFKDKVKNAKCH